MEHDGGGKSITFVWIRVWSYSKICILLRTCKIGTCMLAISGFVLECAGGTIPIVPPRTALMALEMGAL